MADRYPEHPSLAIFDSHQPDPLPAPVSNVDPGLDESEEEIQLDNDGYVQGWGEDASEDEGEGEGGSKSTTRTGAGLLNRELPQPPEFTPFNHHAPEHVRKVTLPPDFPERFLMTVNEDRLTPADIPAPESTEVVEGPIQSNQRLVPGSFFSLFFPVTEFETMANNTNAYAALKGAGESGRRWWDTSSGELMIFVGLLIYMGVHKSIRVGLYWEKSDEFPRHEITEYMSKFRFEQLKRYFHISLPSQPNTDRQNPSQPPACQHWTQKLQPLATNLERRFQSYLLPATNVAIDEMMVRFTGRSVHTVMMRAKPIPQGFKMLALCERGYTYAFMFTSRVDRFSDLQRGLYNGPSQQALSPTSSAVFQLMMSLPYTNYRFVLYCDNYFSNIPLFKALREYSIAACGTTRPNSARYPPVLKFNKHTSRLPWNTLSGVVSTDVLAVVWQDKNVVRFLTTYHECTPEERNFTTRRRKRPRITSSNSELIRAGWGEDHVRQLRIPLLSVNYNDYMGGVDIADQRRSYYYTQLPTCRNWFPLFFWLLDTSIINSFLLSQVYFSTLPSCLSSSSSSSSSLSPTSTYSFLSPKSKSWSAHGFYRTRLAWNLVLEGFRRSRILPTPTAPLPNLHTPSRIQPLGNRSQKRGAGSYITKNYDLNSRRLLPGDHICEKAPRTKNYCLFCRYLSKKPELTTVFHNPNGPKGRVRYTNFQCSFCKVPLCKTFCMQKYHDSLISY